MILQNEKDAKMKKILFLFLSCAALLPLNGMERPLPAREKKLYIKNDFPAPLLIVYRLEYAEEPRSIKLEKKEIKELPDWRQLKQFIIQLYGESQKYTLQEMLKLKPHDYNFEIRQKVAQIESKEPWSDLELVISSYLKGYYGESKGAFVIEVIPFEAPEEKPIIPPSRHLIDALPVLKEH